MSHSLNQCTSGEATTVALNGLVAAPLVVRATCAPGPSLIDIVGAPPHAARDIGVGVRAALRSLGVVVDRATRVTFTPEAPRYVAPFDLAVALAILQALGKIPHESLQGVAHLGELALSGSILPVRGVLPAARGARAWSRETIVPSANAAEVALLAECDVPRLAADLAGVVAHLNRTEALPKACPGGTPVVRDASEAASELSRHPAGREALQAALEGRWLLLVGSPGTMWAGLGAALTRALPAMTTEETLTVNEIYSVAGLIGAAGPIVHRPFSRPSSHRERCGAHGRRRVRPAGRSKPRACRLPSSRRRHRIVRARASGTHRRTASRRGEVTPGRTHDLLPGSPSARHRCGSSVSLRLARPRANELPLHGRSGGTAPGPPRTACEALHRDPLPRLGAGSHGPESDPITAARFGRPR